jgi:hypothetical protein
MTAPSSKTVLVPLLLLGVLGLRSGEAQARAVKHSFALPQQATQDKDSYVRPCVAPGEMPSAAHPGGTVFIVQASVGAPRVSVTEWDLATGSPLGSVETPIASTARYLAIVRAGDWLHLVGAEPYVETGAELPGWNLAYVRLTTGLRVDEALKFARGYGPSIATDGNLVAVAWSTALDQSGQHHAWQLATMTAAGEHLKGATLVKDVGRAIDSSLVEPLVVLGGKVFAWVLDGPRPVDFEGFLLRLDADGHVEVRRRLFFTPFAGHMWTSGDHVVAFDGCSGGTWSTDLRSPGENLVNPYRAKQSCPWFPIAADAGGRLVTGRGDVLAPTMKVEAHFTDVGPDDLWRVPAWNGATPLLVVVTRGGASRVEWAELSPDHSP